MNWQTQVLYTGIPISLMPQKHSQKQWVGFLLEKEREMASSLVLEEPLLGCKDTGMQNCFSREVSWKANGETGEEERLSKRHTTLTWFTQLQEVLF